MAQESSMIRPVGNEELRSVRGAGIVSWVKKAAKWVKKHVVIGLNSIGIKGRF